MANSLNIDLTNKYVVVDKNVYNDEVGIFFCEGGFGCFSFTIGTAVFGKWISDNSKDRIRGYDIVRLDTDDEVKNKEVI